MFLLLSLELERNPIFSQCTQTSVRMILEQSFVKRKSQLSCCLFFCGRDTTSQSGPEVSGAVINTHEENSSCGNLWGALCRGHLYITEHASGKSSFPRAGCGALSHSDSLAVKTLLTTTVFR